MSDYIPAILHGNLSPYLNISWTEKASPFTRPACSTYTELLMNSAKHDLLLISAIIRNVVNMIKQLQTAFLLKFKFSFFNIIDKQSRSIISSYLKKVAKYLLWIGDRTQNLHVDFKSLETPSNYPLKHLFMRDAFRPLGYLHLNVRDTPRA